MGCGKTTQFLNILPKSYILIRAIIQRTKQKEISPSFLGLVATPYKVAKVLGALSPK